MFRKNIQLILSAFLALSAAGCGSSGDSGPAAPTTVKPVASPVKTVTSPAPKTNFYKPGDKINGVDVEILAMLSDEGLAEAGFKKDEDGNYSVKAELNFYQELREVSNLTGQARTDKIEELRKKYPNNFRLVPRALCFVTVPKFRLCNDDGT